MLLTAATSNMTRNIIAALIFRAKKAGNYFVSYRNELYSLDELLSLLTGREVEFAEAETFLKHA
jgi:hypothetical protein